MDCVSKLENGEKVPMGEVTKLLSLYARTEASDAEQKIAMGSMYNEMMSDLPTFDDEDGGDDPYSGLSKGPITFEP